MCHDELFLPRSLQNWIAEIDLSRSFDILQRASKKQAEVSFRRKEFHAFIRKFEIAEKHVERT